MYGYAIRRFPRPPIDGYDFGRETDLAVQCIVERIIDEQNAICWGVDCSHVARYLDKNYETYLKHSSQAVQLLESILTAYQSESGEFVSLMDEAKEFLDGHKKAHDQSGEVEAPGATPRVTGDGLAGQGAMP